MKNYYKRYLILAVVGAAIIGLSVYLFLHNYLDRIDIVVAACDLEAGTVITEDELKFQEYYPGSIPEDYITSKDEITGKQINTGRRKDDYISADMFSGETDENIFESLSPGEALVAIEVKHSEPILKKLKKGDLVTIISTEREKEFADMQMIVDTGNLSGQDEETYLKNAAKTYGYKQGYMDRKTVILSENIMAVDGHITVRNLEIIEITESKTTGNNLLINDDKSTVSLYFICSFKEAPIVSRLTEEGNYKIIYEKI
ncbi:MAG: flagella basal body P-ring formation protein FlgA [Actinobacteria bacterium]|nr:flagella basal body P-ring formation protein FlgA [Actinomycetota bacterium]